MVSKSDPDDVLPSGVCGIIICVSGAQVPPPPRLLSLSICRNPSSSRRERRTVLARMDWRTPGGDDGRHVGPMVLRNRRRPHLWSLLHGQAAEVGRVGRLDADPSRASRGIGRMGDRGVCARPRANNGRHGEVVAARGLQRRSSGRQQVDRFVRPRPYAQEDGLALKNERSRRGCRRSSSAGDD